MIAVIAFFTVGVRVLLEVTDLQPCRNGGAEEIAQGVDDETWLYHLRRRDYSRWLDDCVKDTELGRAIARIEAETADQAAALSRERITTAIEEHYTLPAQAPQPTS